MRYRRVPNLGTDYIQTIERINILERIVQAIGFTPDFPYTLNVNDATRNRVLIGKINGDYGIKIVNNAGVTIVFADGHITASGITTGTLDASIVNVTNLNADNIITGTLSATKIVGGTLDCSVLTVTNLSASSITTGTMDGDRISVGTLDADRIKAHDITSYQLSTGELITETAQIKDAVIVSAHINDLNASKINAGTLNVDRIQANSIIAGKLSISQISDINVDLGNITAGTITGALVRTSSGPSRIEMSNSGLKVYVGGSIVGAFDWGGAYLVSDQVFNFAGTGNDLGQIYYSTDFTGMTIKSSYQINLRGGSNGVYISKMGSTLDMNNHRLEVDDIYSCDQGFIEMHDGLYISDDMTIDDGVWIGGDLDVQGDKDFLIPHPDRSERLLKYSSVESPEVALSCRGVGKVLKNGEVKVTPPKHFVLVTEQAGLVTVDLTSIGENNIYLKELPKHSGFVVIGKPETKFVWRLTAIRKGRLNNEVEIDLKDQNSEKARRWIEKTKRHNKSRYRKFEKKKLNS